MNERRYEFDWLRVLAIINVFIFHCVLFFSKGSWHLKNNIQNGVLDIVPIGLMWMWMMPIIFLVSGFGSWYALENKTSGKYILDRFFRLIIPLFTVGMFIMLPPQFYFDLITNSNFTGSFWQSIPLFFKNFGIALHKGPYIILTSFYGHLWFLIFLFVMSLVILPLLKILKTEKGRKFISGLSEICNLPGGILIFLIPIFIVKLILTGFFHNHDSWADFGFYLIFFLIGYILPADKRFTLSIKKHWVLFLIMGVVGFGGVGIFKGVFGYGYPNNEVFTNWQYYPFQFIVSTTQLGFVLFFISIGMKFLNFNNKFLTYSNEAALPFYILHQTIILLIGWFIRLWNIMILPKFLILIIVSFILTIIIYELFIRHFNIVRIFFGMRMINKTKED